MGQGRFGHDRILSGVIVCHVVGNNGVFPERGSRGPCVGFWGPGSIWQRMWYFSAKFLWIKGVFYHGLCVIVYAGRIVPCLHWYLIRVIGRMTSLEWFSIWETSNNIINFNDVRKRLWKLIWLSKDARKNIEKSGSSLYARQPHLASTYGSKNSLTHPTLLACFIIRASFETVKVLVTHGRTQKTYGENIITETLMAVPNTFTQQRRCYHATGHLQQRDNRPIWRHRHTWTSPQNMRTPLPCNTGSTTVTQPWYHDHLKWTTWNTYVQSVSKTSQQSTNIISTGRTITL